MTRLTSKTLLLIFGLLSSAAASPSLAQAEDPDPKRYDAQIQQFLRWDAKNTAPRNAILFVGSSSIVGWKTASRFAGLPVINRGFGGSHISDVVHYLDETVLRHRPRAVVFYAGDNDVAAGKSPEQVRDDYREFVDGLHAMHPGTPVVFLAIKPSTARWSHWPTMQQANALIAADSATDPALHVLDMADELLGPDGKPREELLIADGLHLTAAGYDVWTRRTLETLAELGLAPLREVASSQP